MLYLKFSFFWRILDEYTTKLESQALVFLLFMWINWLLVQLCGLLYYLLIYLFFYFYWDSPEADLCSQSALELIRSPASASRVLGPQAWTILLGYFLISGSNAPICFSPTPQHTVSSFCHHLCHCLVRFKVSSVIRPDLVHMSQQLRIFHMVRG